MKIIRGFKRRQYEFYRVAAFHIEHMARALKTNAKLSAFNQSRIAPPYEELDLTPQERKELDTWRLKKQATEYEAQFKKKMMKKNGKS